MSSINRSKLYTDFTNAYVSAYPDKVRSIAFSEAQKAWNEIKTDEGKIHKNISDLKILARGKQGSLQSYWANMALKKTTPAANTAVSTISNLPATQQDEFESKNLGAAAAVAGTSAELEPGIKKFATPSEDQAQSELHEINNQLLKLHDLKGTGLMTDELSAKAGTCRV